MTKTEDTEILQGIKIWHGDATAKDVYVDFKGTFKPINSGKVILRISCDSNYVVKINGMVAGFAACADYPRYRNYDEIDISKLCNVYSENTFEVAVWHYGVDSQTYIAADAYLLFDIKQRSGTLLKSDENILSRINNRYKNGYLKTISSQMGLSFLYDATKAENEFTKSTETGEGSAVKRKRDKCKLVRAKEKCKVTKTDGGYLIEFSKETVGFPVVQLYSKTEQKITVSYGEHLMPDGSIPRFIGGRDFSFEYIAKVGVNDYINMFRRIACKYLFVESEDEISIRYIGIRRTDYPMKTVGRKFDDELLQKIYDVSEYTIKCCMHEHYEDCPWREQAMYTMDSRNQMLCGYYMTSSFVYPRENLVLISKGLRPDGLLSLCFPAGNDYPIPFFSLVYIMQVYEYIKYSKDESILDEVGGTLDEIMSTFLSKIADNRLIAQLPVPYWNFYEWAEDSANDNQLSLTEESHTPLSYDLNLNCMLVYVSTMYNEMRGKNIDVEPMKKAIKEVFYDEKRGVFRLTSLTEKTSVLGNSLAFLAGLGDEKLAEKIASGEGMIPITLSMNAFKYDALMKFGDKYNGYILDDIRKIYGKMLEAGATTFWETELGWEDFGGAGSLCHGWSAIPVYYLCRIFGKKPAAEQD